MKRPIVFSVAALCATILACFSERGAGPGPSGAELCSVPVTVIDSMHFVVAMRDFRFRPDSISVPTGATVTWVNCEEEGVEPHTTTSDAPDWDSPDLVPSARYSHRFPTPGTFPYHCVPHELLGMVGRIVVQ